MQRTSRVLALVGGLCAAAAGLVGGLGGIAVALTSAPEDRLIPLVMAAAIGLLGVGLGGALAWQAARSMSGRASSPWRPRRTWVCVALVAGAILVGHWSLGHPPVDLILLPGAHVAATALPPAIMLTMAVRSLDADVSRRHLLAQVSSGAFLSSFLAATAEMLLIIVLTLAAVLIVAALPGGSERLENLAGLDTSALLQDPARLAEMARSPWLWATALIVASVAIPVIEEMLKGVGISLMLYRRPGRGEVYLWGLAGGAGFSMMESALNSLLGLQNWAVAVLMRIPTSLMHCFTGALMGLAWHAAFVERRWKRGLGLLCVCVSLHGAWNALAISSGLLSLAEPPALPAGGATLGAGLGAALLLALAAGVAVAFIAVTRRMRSNGSPAEVDDLPSARQR